MESAGKRPERATLGLALAWLAISGLFLATLALQALPLDPESEALAARLSLVVMRMQGQYVVGVSGFTGKAGDLYRQIRALDTGTLAQRQRFVVLAAEIIGPGEAGLQTVDLDGLIEQESSRHGSDFRPTGQELAAQRGLRELYLGPDGRPGPDSAEAQLERLAALSAEDRDALRLGLGWFGELALAPKGLSETGVRDDVISGSRRVMFTVVAAATAALGAGFVGFAALITFIVLAFKGDLNDHWSPGLGYHGIYAETFAIWIVGFFGLQLLVGQIEGIGLWGALAAFPISLLALGWPGLRGVRWERVRRDIGLTPGPAPWLEVIFGGLGYLMTLPILAVGVLMTLALTAVQGWLSGPIDPFTPAAGPAHPIVFQLAEGGWGLRLQVLLLAAVLAPLVEETMFRGVLYRHLREVSGRFGRPLSVLISATLNTLIFAGVHPQGWVAVPALMGLAYGFVLLREWRGSLLPAMVAHGLSNGLVMTMLILLLSN